jgi:hypothetical protein
MDDLCRGCGEEFNANELFEMEDYDGSWCSECQMEIERDIVESLDYLNEEY